MICVSLKVTKLFIIMFLLSYNVLVHHKFIPENDIQVKIAGVRVDEVLR